MRCKNCGWDNPGGNAQCEKCNAPLSPYMMEEEAALTVRGSSLDFDVKATVAGCIECGYPVKPGDTECPSCGHSVSGKDNEKKTEKALASGTIIQGTASDKDSGNNERKKLVGFLVTFSHSSNGEFFPLYEGKNTIGRGFSSQICIQGDPNISEKHLSILHRPVDGKYKFKDEQSSNGTFINETLIDEGELKNLDKIRIGATQLLFIEIPREPIE